MSPSSIRWRHRWSRRASTSRPPAYDGIIIFSVTDGHSGFTYTRNFRTPSDDYVYTLDYIGAASANGTDDTGTAIVGYKWWNFAYPTLLTSGADAPGERIRSLPRTAASTSVGPWAPCPREGVSFATWNYLANAGGWAAAASILAPLDPAAGSVATGLVAERDAFTRADRGRRRHGGHGGCEQQLRFRDAGVPGRSHQRYRDRESDRHHHERRTYAVAHRRARGGHSRQGVRSSPGPWVL